ncbi:MAG: type IX secretion system sortase PorU [Cryomorphaceae bacterium]|nr:type IX secretion system sortase PorU [Cryomorphaceae bacterium]
MNKTLIFLMSLLSLPGIAQRDVSLSVSIDWKDVSSVPPPPVGSIGFDDAIWPDELPWKHWETEVFFSEGSEIELFDVEKTELLESQLTERQKKLAPEGLIFESRTVNVRLKNILQVRVLTVWKENGRFYKLVSANMRPTGAKTRGNRSLSWADHSVLAEGQWYKFALSRDGVYKLDRNFLISLGVDVSNVNPQSINIYGNGGEQLPFSNSIERYDDPRKNAIVVAGESDGSFDQNDYILFYGKGPDSWVFNEVDQRFLHSKHPWSDSAFYFLRVDDPEPLRMQLAALETGNENNVVDAFTDHQFIETENVNLNKSGREFFGDRFDLTLSITYPFSVQNLLSEPAYFEASVAARSLGTPSAFEVSIGSEELTLTPSSTSDGATSNIANIANAGITFTPSSGNTLNVVTNFIKGVPDAEGWLDFFRLQTRRQLIQVGSQMQFRDPASVGVGNISKFSLLNTSPASLIWDISDHTRPEIVSASPAGNNGLEFTVSTEVLKEFIVFSDFNYLTPTAIGAIDNQDLHALNDIDLVVVTNDRFVAAAEEYAAIHENDGLSIAIVTTNQVFNEFSSGSNDPTAIKMLMKMLYDRADGDETLAPKYLQIIGDGTYQNRNLAANSPYVITYQSANSVSPTNSYVSDDYFGFLDDIYGEGLGDKMQIGVGRIPSETLSEAMAYLNKVKVYRASNTTVDGGAYCVGDENPSPFGAWRNTITLVTDDMDGNGGPTEVVHMVNSDEHANTVYDLYNEYDVAKIYMDAYQQVSTPGGERYPEAEEAIRRRVQNGSLIVNYIGHGGERGWAHERVLNTTTIQEWTNINRLPVFMTATCELARFDDPEVRSAGEMLILNPNGGCIAMLTTTRIVFSGSNQQLNRAFFDVALEDEIFEPLTLGFISETTKNDNQVNDSSNKRNFSLLGDVALEMAYPKMEVYTTEINGVTIDPAQPDTLKSLQQVTFKGFVGDQQGNKLTTMNGFVYPTVWDKESVVQTLNNDGAAQPYTFEVTKNIVYRGKASVTNGDFEFTFVVPRDINYEFGKARVSYYAVAGDLDAHGFSEDFFIGGALEGAELNTVGPDVNLYLNDSTFVFGGITNENPLLYAVMRDENGINTVGSGIGHDIKAILDGESASPIVLNDFYESDLDTYQSGAIRYQLNDLSEGLHTLNLKVWDIHNNSSEVYTEFVVASSANLALDHVLNYPNPFTTHTEFMFEHNQACAFLDVQIQVFSVSGKMVKTLNRVVRTDGFRSDPIAWDGLDDFGDTIGRGVYVYRVQVTTPEGQKAEKFEKLVILR